MSQRFNSTFIKSGVLTAGLGLFLTLGVGAGFTAQPSRPVTLRPIDDKILKAEMAKRRGKLVLVSLWSKSCPPCVKGYPELVKMGRKYGPKGLEILSINVIDDAKTRKVWTLPFLQKQKPTFATFYNNSKDDDAFIKAVGSKWGGELPAELLFDRNGKNIVAMIDNVDLKKLDALIAQKLKS